jgi:hypothetical protein
MMIASIFFVWFLIPETKSIPLEHMDRLFAARPVRKANSIVLAEIQLQEEEFRRDAEGAGLSAAKSKLDQHFETVEK